MRGSLSYHIFPLGDSALIIDLGNVIDESLNKLVHSFYYQLKDVPIAGIVEVVPGYSSLTVYYDVLSIKQKLNQHKTAFELISESIQELLSEDRKEMVINEDLFTVPVCYDKKYSPDIGFIAERNNISAEEVIHLHTSSTYQIYMLGFLPGFAYMGQVDDRIACPRKPQPVLVEPGSVGIAGKQTGIYPLRSPGGWQIIGSTPLKLFNKDKDEPVLFKPVGRVQFYSITIDEFNHLKNNPSLL
jgi:inhibitor of KinA